MSDNQESESATQLPLHLYYFHCTVQHKTSYVGTERLRVNFHFVDISLRAIISLSVYFFVIISLFSFSCTQAFKSEVITDILNMIHPHVHECYPLIS
jgi:hypothetical protein